MRYKILLGFLLLGSFSVLAQGPSKANKEYNEHNYFDAIEVYQKVYENGYSSPEILLRLANSYYFNAEYTKAVTFYEKLYNENQSSLSGVNMLRYANSLKATGAYKMADKVMEKFVAQSDEPEMVAALTKKAETYLDEIEKNSGRFTISNAGFNSKARDYGVAFYRDEQLVYTSTRDTGGIVKRRNGWDNQAYSQLYLENISNDTATEVDTTSSKKSKNKSNTSEKFSKVLNTKYNESTPVFTRDGKTVYFTRNNYTDGKLGYDPERTILLKVYRSTFDGDQWSEAVELPFNSDNFNCAHPALSVDEKYLYFASDRPGGLGQSDLYKVSIEKSSNLSDSEGSSTSYNYGQPENLGNLINTPGRDTFPFISKENDLYFASDGQLGLGGLDVFVVNLSDYQKNQIKPQNVGKEVNTTFDDFNFIINDTTREGYFTSNRTEDNQGLDDIYKFKELKRIERTCTQALAGVVMDSKTSKAIPFAKVELYDKDHKILKQQDADNEGKFDFGSVPCGTLYNIKATKDGYDPNEVAVTIPNEIGKTVETVTLAPKQTVKDLLVVGGDLKDILNIPLIYFDLDKSYIRPDAAVELAKVLMVMQQYPTMHIDIRSHTDCRASYAYNMSLSERRAQSTRDWLIANGIAPYRLTAKGYGESQLVNDCSCEPTNVSPCSEAEHQLNRRSNFIITKM